MTELSRSNRSYSGDLKTFTAAEKTTRKSSLMSVLKLLNLQKFLKYKMENIAACCAWCAPKGSCVMERFQGGREGTV